LTCSLLAGTDRREGVDLLLSPEQIYTWRLTGLTLEISQHLLCLSPSRGIRIDQAVFVVEKVSTTPAEHPEAQQETYEALLARGEKKENLHKVILHFLPPGATFRVGDHQQPFPLPYWVFRSLLSTWNAFAPPSFKDLETTLVNAVRKRESKRFSSQSDADVLKKILEEMVALHNWRGETKHVQLGGYETSTFTGKFEYKIAKPFPELGRLVGLMAEFAFYAGVGWQTTHGLGQVRTEFP